MWLGFVYCPTHKEPGMYSNLPSKSSKNSAFSPNCRVRDGLKTTVYSMMPVAASINSPFLSMFSFTVWLTKTWSTAG